jgi:hypothetical protein
MDSVKSKEFLTGALLVKIEMLLGLFGHIYLLHCERFSTP